MSSGKGGVAGRLHWRAGMKNISILLGMVLLQACSRSSLLPPPPSEPLRGRMEIVDVETPPTVPEIQLKTAAGGWLAGIPAGACDIATMLFEVGADPSADQAAMIGLFAPVGLVIGAVYGAIVALPPEEVQRGERTLRDVLQEARSGFATRVKDQLNAQSPVPGARKGEDVVLSVETVTLSLTGPYWLDPFLSPSLKVRCRLIRPLDRAVLYEAELHHSGPGRHFTEWASSAGDLRRYFEQAFQQIAEVVLDEVLLTLPPPKP